MLTPHTVARSVSVAGSPCSIVRLSTVPETRSLELSLREPDVLNLSPACPSRTMWIFSCVVYFLRVANRTCRTNR